MFCEKNFENAVKFTTNVLAPEAHGHSFCFDLVFRQCNRSCRLQTKMVEVVKIDPKRSEEWRSHVFEIEGLALMYMKGL